MNGKNYMRRKLPEPGDKYGRWTIIKLSEKVGEYFNLRNLKSYPVKYYTCKCECGNIHDVRGSNLQSGSSLSCGCLVYENVSKALKKYNCPPYIRKLWNGIKERCLSIGSLAYKHYGGRGINICQFIYESPDNLFLILGDRLLESDSIDRLDNDGHYSCGQCDECKINGWKLNIAWKSRSEQASNKRPTRLIINGIEKSCYEWTMEYKKLLENDIATTKS